MSKNREGYVNSVLFRLDRILYFFHFRFVACREVKSIWSEFYGIFHLRNIFATPTQPGNIFPSFCLLCVPSTVVEIIVFSGFFSFEIHVRNNAQFASDCLISSCWLFYFVVLCLRLFVVQIKLKRLWFIRGNHIFLSLFQLNPLIVIAFNSFPIIGYVGTIFVFR